MRTRSQLCLLLPIALACSGTEPTEVQPEFAIMCSPPRATVASYPTISRLKNSSYSKSFTVRNNCSVGVSLTLKSSRTGAIASVGTPSPATMTLAAGTAKSAAVSYRTGAPGSGTVVLTATTTAGRASWGTLYVTVTN
jgi:hypothetical protein